MIVSPYELAAAGVRCVKVGTLAVPCSPLFLVTIGSLTPDANVVAAGLTRRPDVEQTARDAIPPDLLTTHERRANYPHVL